MRADRLLELAEHLEKGQLGHERFDFNILHRGFGYRHPKYTCGAVGCAMGELPQAFPDEWGFDSDSNPCLIVNDRVDSMGEQVATFFDIDGLDYLVHGIPHHSVVDYLFYPRSYYQGGDESRGGLVVVDYLFYPRSYYSDRERVFEGVFGAPRLPESATKDEVAAHIRRFVAHFQEKA